MNSSLKEKIVVLRMTRIGHIPPALSSTQILNENGFPITVVEFGNLTDHTHFISSPIPKLRLGCQWLKFLPRQLHSTAILAAAFFRIFTRVMRGEIPALFIAHGLHEQFLTYLFKKCFGISYIVQVHEVYNPRDLNKSPIIRLLLYFEKKALRNATFLIFPEATRAKIYTDRYQLSCPIYTVFNCPRLHIKNNSIDVRQELGIPKNHHLLAYLGGVGQLNRIQEAIQALATVPLADFLIWGWGDESYLNQLKKIARDYGVTDRVHFLGQLNEDKWQWLEDCDLSYCVYGTEFLRTRYQATASNKLMESLAAGVPVIVSNNKDFKEIIRTYDVGICSSELSAQAIAKAFKAFFQDQVGRKRRSVNALNSHRTQLNFEYQFKPVLEAFKNLNLPIPVLTQSTEKNKQNQKTLS